jgi:hypothetical protein
MRRRAMVGWILSFAIGLGFLVGPVFTHHDLTGSHIVAHLVVGPLLMGLALAQLMAARRGLARRAVDGLLAVLGVWLGVMPFVIVAPGAHVHAHVALGALVAIAGVWNVVAPAPGGVTEAAPVAPSGRFG